MTAREEAFDEFEQNTEPWLTESASGNTTSKSGTSSNTGAPRSSVRASGSPPAGRSSRSATSGTTRRPFGPPPGVVGVAGGGPRQGLREYVGGNSYLEQTYLNAPVAWWWDNRTGKWEPVIGKDFEGVVPNWWEKSREELFDIAQDMRPDVEFSVYPNYGAGDDQINIDTQTGGGGGGGGRGALRAPFVPTDPAAVRDQVKAYIVATTGTNRPDLLDHALGVFQAAERQNYDAQGGIDPWTKMTEYVRGTSVYRNIHELRPDSVDEMDWVTEPQAKLKQLGLSAQAAEGLGIAQATVGAADDALIEAAQMTQVQRTGRLLDSQRQSLKNKARAVANLVK